MGADTNIGWCDSTVNPTSGCHGCELWSATVRTCYAGILHESRLAKSFPDKYDPDFLNVRLIPGRMQQAANWKDLRGVERKDKPWLNGFPRCIFVGDMGDFLSKGIPFDYLDKEVLGSITSKSGNRHIWMLLTKRPGRLAEWSDRHGGLPDNVVAMTTVTTQRTADIRVPELLKVRAKYLGLSCEPLLGPVSLIANCPPHYAPHLRFDRIGWAIIGGASGKDAAPCNLEWIRILKSEVLSAGGRVFVKQLGGVPMEPESVWRDRISLIGRANVLSAKNVSRVPADMVPLAFSHPKGEDWTEWPEDLRVRQMFNYDFPRCPETKEQPLLEVRPKLTNPEMPTDSQTR